MWTGKWTAFRGVAMRWLQRLCVTTLILSPMWACAASQDVTKSSPKLDDIVKIEFPKDGYTFTLAEAAKGIKIQYKIIVVKDYEGVIPLANPPSYHEPAGPSG